MDIITKVPPEICIIRGLVPLTLEDLLESGILFIAEEAVNEIINTPVPIGEIYTLVKCSIIGEKERFTIDHEWRLDEPFEFWFELGKEIELEASYIPLGTTQPVISLSWSGTITVSTDIISIDLASSETEPIMTRVILNPPAGTCKEGEEITLTGELLGMLSEEHSTPYTFPIVGASIKIYDADIGLEDLKFGPDLLASGTTDLQGRFTVTWTCQVTDWILIWPERTVEIYASFEGNERLLSSSSQQYTVQVEE